MLSMFTRALSQAVPSTQQHVRASAAIATCQRGLMTGRFATGHHHVLSLPVQPVGIAALSPGNLARASTLRLNTLHPFPGRRKRRRIGRGWGSGHGKTAGRGTKGQNARGGIKGMNLFEGGQTPFWRKVPKTGFTNNRFKKKFAYVNVDKLQMWINQGRIDVTERITMKEILRAKLVKRCKDGIKLLGVGELTCAVDIEVARASKSSIKKVEAMGGRIVCGWYNKLALRALTRPESFIKKGRVIPRRAKPPPREIEYYLSYANRGYLSTEVQMETLLRRKAAALKAEAEGIKSTLAPVQAPLLH